MHMNPDRFPSIFKKLYLKNLHFYYQKNKTKTISFIFYKCIDMYPVISKKPIQYVLVHNYLKKRYAVFVIAKLLPNVRLHHNSRINSE